MLDSSAVSSIKKHVLFSIDMGLTFWITMALEELCLLFSSPSTDLGIDILIALSNALPSWDI